MSFANRRRRLQFLFAAAVAPVLLVPASQAQFTEAVDSNSRAPGAIEGTLLAPIQSRSVTGVVVTAVETGAVAVVDKHGHYAFPSLPPGTYKLVAAGDGFSHLRITGVVVEPGHLITLSPQVMPIILKDGELQTLEEVVVKASRLEDVERLAKYVVLEKKAFTDQNVDIVRTIDDAQPYYIMNSQTIEQSAAVNVESFLKQRLTMNVSATSNTQNPAVTTAGSSIDLRGFGPSQTLILINGRRTASTVLTGKIGQPDVNSIPSGAIDRIEVLPSSSAAKYGGSAVGGVINIILKHNYTGGEIRAIYDNTADTNAPIRTLDASYGISFEGGKTNLMIYAHYLDSDTLLVQDRRGLAQRGINRILANSPSFLLNPTSPPPLGNTPNIASTTGTNLVLRDGTPLNSPYTFIPSGYTAGLNPAALVANAGHYNLELPNTWKDPVGLLRMVTAEPKVKSLATSLRRQMSEKLELFTEFSTTSNTDFGAVQLPVTAVLIVPASAPTNPFKQAVGITIPTYKYNRYIAKNVGRRWTVGAVLQLPYGWAAESDYTWSYDRSSYFSQFGTGTAFNTALADGTVNPFVDTVAHPLNLTPYLGSFASTSPTTLNDLGLRLVGPLWTLPAGATTLALGLEHRKEGMDDSGIFFNETTNAFRHYLGQSQTVDSGYAEVTVPLISKANALPGVRQLDLNLAVRTEKFKVGAGTTFQFEPGFGTLLPLYRSTINYTSTNPTLGLRYKPIESVMLRASYGTAFLPPDFSQFLAPLVGGGAPGNTTIVIDPRRGNASTTVSFISGGNPGIKPQTSKDWNVGAVFTPRLPVDLRFNVEWYKIRLNNQALTPTPQQIVSAESQYPGRVVRNTPAPGDPYGVGPITLVDYSLLNAAQTETSGFDLSLDYRVQTEAFGTFNLLAGATLIEHFKRQAAVGSPLAEIVNQVANGGPLSRKANLVLTWRAKQWMLGWITTYYGSYATLSAALAAQGSDHIARQVYHDLFAEYRFAKSSGQGLPGSMRWAGSLLKNTTVRFGVRNVFKTDPPFSALDANYLYSSSFADLRLRSYSVSVTKDF